MATKIQFSSENWSFIGDSSMMGEQNFSYNLKTKEFIFEDSGGIFSEEFEERVKLSGISCKEVTVYSIYDDKIFSFFIIVRFNKITVAAQVDDAKIKNDLCSHLSTCFKDSGSTLGFFRGDIEELQLQKYRSNCSNELLEAFKECEEQGEKVTFVKIFAENMKELTNDELCYYFHLYHRGTPVFIQWSNNKVNISPFWNKNAEAELLVNKDITISPSGDRVSLKKDLVLGTVNFANSQIHVSIKLVSSEKNLKLVCFATIKNVAKRNGPDLNISEIKYNSGNIEIKCNEQVFDTIHGGKIYSNDYRDMIAIHNPENKMSYSIHFFDEESKEKFFRSEIIKSKDDKIHVFFDDENFPLIVTELENSLIVFSNQRYEIPKDELKLSYLPSSEKIIISFGGNEIVFHDDNQDLSSFYSRYKALTYSKINKSEALNCLLGLESKYFKMSLWAEFFMLRDHAKSIFGEDVMVNEDNYQKYLQNVVSFLKPLEAAINYYSTADLYVSCYVHQLDLKLNPAVGIVNLNSLKSVISSGKNEIRGVLNAINQEVNSVLALEGMKEASFGASMAGAFGAIMIPTMALGAISSGVNAINSNEELKDKKIAKVGEVTQNVVARLDRYINNQLPLSSYYLLENLLNLRLQFYSGLKKSDKYFELVALKERISRYETFTLINQKKLEPFLLEFDDIINNVKPVFKYAI